MQDGATPPINQPLDPSSGRSISAVNYFSNHGYDHRSSTSINPLVGGENAFNAVATALKSAQKSINMAFWGLDPGMLLIRGTQTNYDRINTLADILYEKARANVKVNVIVWDHPFSFIGSGSDGGSAIVEQNNSKNLGKFREIATLIPDLNVKLTNSHSAIPGSGSYHQKFIVIDVETPPSATAFIMGHNMMPNYWGTTELPPRNAKREFYLEIVNNDEMVEKLDSIRIKSAQIANRETYQSTSNYSDEWLAGTAKLKRQRDNLLNSLSGAPFSYTSHAYPEMKPLLDVSTQIWGDGIVDVYHSFERIWNLNGGTAEPTHASLNQSAFRNSGHRNSSVSQVAATFPEKNETSIRRLYLNAITNANKYVFILNQYFRDLDLTDEIIAAYKRRGIIGKKTIPFVVVSNSFEGEVTQEGHDTKVLSKFTKAKIPVDYCRMVTNSAVGRKDIYVHAKVLIVDDVFYTIGSANFNDRSLRSDPELNIGVVDPAEAKQLRQDLWNIVIGKPINEIMKNPDEGVKLWLKYLAENDKRFNENVALKNGCAITFKPTGWRGFWPTKWAMVPTTSTTRVS